MTTLESNAIKNELESFLNLGVDDQLEFLWYVYEDVGSSITPAAPGTAGEEIAQGLFNQVKDKSHEEQLQIQRDIASKKDTQISREYGALGENTKLVFWYILAQGMENGTIVPMPDDYEMDEKGKNLFAQIQKMEYEEQITFLREAVMPMGAEAKQGAEI